MAIQQAGFESENPRSCRSFATLRNRLIAKGPLATSVALSVIAVNKAAGDSVKNLDDLIRVRTTLIL
jgi:hypothetical protein